MMKKLLCLLVALSWGCEDLGGRPDVAAPMCVAVDVDVPEGKWPEGGIACDGWSVPTPSEDGIAPGKVECFPRDGERMLWWADVWPDGESVELFLGGWKWQYQKVGPSDDVLLIYGEPEAVEGPCICVHEDECPPECRPVCQR